MHVIRIMRTLGAALLFSIVFMHTRASADSPPDMPLPPCTIVDGEEQGACPSTDEAVTGQASGAFSEGNTVTIQTVPTAPVCVSHNGYPPYPWNPSPCYSAVHSPVVVGCAVIDLTDGETFREMSCAQALYRDTSDMPYPNFTLTGPDDSAGCGASGNFQTYIYGGPANVPGARWSEFGPAELECSMAFNGTRPDGLYGPTWVKLRVGIDQAQNGDNRRGYGKYTEIYVSIDGDMRETPVDVDVLATFDLEGSGDNRTVTYTATLTNEGTTATDEFEVLFDLPRQLHFQRSLDPRCEHREPRPFVGGTVACTGVTLEGINDPLGNNVDFFDIVTRIINASDLDEPVTISANVPDDVDTSNNEDTATVRPTLVSGTVADTRQAMAALAPYFDYETPTELLNRQCDVYMYDIFDRLQAIKAQAPEVFANLSFGKITSGDYYWAPIENDITRAGHVGVVVYLKGSNYHETGIVVHGTPTWSPEDRNEESQLGTMAAGEHTTLNVFREGTADHGLYYRTAIDSFPGSPEAEPANGCGFEGAYSSTNDEFEGAIPADCRTQPQNDVSGPSCPFFPDAVVVQTESPVEILAANPQGQRVETLGGSIFVQELDSGIHSIATPHDDGTFGWTLVLPADDYDIQLLGTAAGPYKLTLKQFNENGERVETVIEGTTESGQVDNYDIDAAPPPPTSGGGGTGGSGSGGSGNSGSGSSGGGGSFGWFGLLLLVPALRLPLHVRRIPENGTGHYLATGNVPLVRRLSGSISIWIRLLFRSRWRPVRRTNAGILSVQLPTRAIGEYENA